MNTKRRSCTWGWATTTSWCSGVAERKGAIDEVPTALVGRTTRRTKQNMSGRFTTRRRERGTRRNRWLSLCNGARCGSTELSQPRKIRVGEAAKPPAIVWLQRGVLRLVGPQIVGVGRSKKWKPKARPTEHVRVLKQGARVPIPPPHTNCLKLDAKSCIWRGGG